MGHDMGWGTAAWWVVGVSIFVGAVVRCMVAVVASGEGGGGRGRGRC